MDYTVCVHKCTRVYLIWVVLIFLSEVIVMLCMDIPGRLQAELEGGVHSSPRACP